jgi:hypothetical protein
MPARGELARATSYFLFLYPKEIKQNFSDKSVTNAFN